MKRQKPLPAHNTPRLHIFVIVLLRLLIGWHFLFEGVSKILMPEWTSAGYLQNSRWILADFFHMLAANPALLQIVDILNIAGLTLIGLCLILGLFTRLASLVGVFLLALYYIANPPLVGFDFGLPAEGSYIVVNKNLIEMAVLLALAIFPASYHWGFDRLIFCLRRRSESAAKAGPEQRKKALPPSMPRRELLKALTTLPVLGAFAYAAYKKARWEKVNAITGATIKLSDTKLKDLKGTLPIGKIKDFEISRLIMGGNLIGGWAHSRDLIYVPSLFKAYNTDQKVFETLHLAEKAGINTMNGTGSQLPLLNKYRRIYGSTLKIICQVHPTREEPRQAIDYAIDNGADILQIQGNCCDWRVRDGEIDVLIEAMDYIRSQDYIAGLGAHSIQALIACDNAGILPDFYMKTLHHDQYWSAHPRENRVAFEVDGEKSVDHDKFHDNIFCLFPEQTVEFMKSKQIPLIAFKILAGGAIHPVDGFRFAFENGADFICVGMFDWQIVDDVNITLDVLADLTNRQRRWYA
ncbi:DoxX family membrane protein [candidate division KSB1 bacterium]|nr:DoxX family membrane protein [candidate division KSB1 bacterium]RQW00405.1 MAG: DoxX family membrane protein [candidate division KSB1 bacterium]